MLNIKKSTFRLVKGHVLDTIFPAKCIECRKFTTEYLFDGSPTFVCQKCIEKIPIQQKTSCIFCDAPTVDGETCPFCIREHDLDQLLAVTDYKHPLTQKIIKTMKYRFVSSVSIEMARLMIAYLQSSRFNEYNWSSYSIVPVPLHHRRLNWRGFNQAEKITDVVAKGLGCEYRPDALKRKLHTKPQADIENTEQRKENIKGIFRYNLDLPLNKRVLLVDDVSTTGATLDECARVLKNTGHAESVTGVVFARG